jgi:hypothetical protein
LFENKYKHLGYSKILNFDEDCPFYVYYIYNIIKEMSLNINNDLLVVLPESEKIFNNLFVGSEISSIIEENPKLDIVISTNHITNIKNKQYVDVYVGVVSDNEVVVRYPNRDPIRFLLRPTLSSSNINFKKSEVV